MGLSSEMKNLSEELLSSFKQRIKENEELVSDVQKTLDGFRKDHMEMAGVLNAKAMHLRKDLAKGEIDRMKSYNGLMSEIHNSMASIRLEVSEIQASTFNMINEFASDRTVMATDLNKFFAEGRAERKEDETIRMAEFETLMKSINADIKNINEEVSTIFKETNEMLADFEKEHLEMSAELKAELGKNLTERVNYTSTMLLGFQKRLAEISKENQKMAQNLRKDLASGETSRFNDYKGLMKNIHASIKGIRKEVSDIQKSSERLIGDYSRDRVEGAAAWNKMQDEIAKLRQTGLGDTGKKVAVNTEKKKEPVTSAPIETVSIPVEEMMNETSLMVGNHVEAATEDFNEMPGKLPEKTVEPTNLIEKVLDYINKHPMGVKVSEMEAPLGETRMKIGFVAKALLEEGKVQKMDNIYFPIK